MVVWVVGVLGCTCLFVCSQMIASCVGTSKILYILRENEDWTCYFVVVRRERQCRVRKGGAPFSNFVVSFLLGHRHHLGRRLVVQERNPKTEKPTKKWKKTNLMQFRSENTTSMSYDELCATVFEQMQNGGLSCGAVTSVRVCPVGKRFNGNPSSLELVEGHEDFKVGLRNVAVSMIRNIAAFGLMRL